MNGSAVKRAFGGATASMSDVHATLNEDNPDTIIINAGTNNFSKKKWQTPEDTATEIIEIVKTCQREGVRKIFVSSITCRPLYQKKINRVNEFLQHYANIFKYECIDNACIKEEHLKKDGVHLNQEGICILARIFLAHLNLLYRGRNFSNLD